MRLASEMAAFAHVAELGSFTAAARALGVPKVAVSRAIASLERRLDSHLLTRTTRRVALTPAGMLLQPHCQRLLREVDAVRSRFAASAGALRLRVLVDAGYGRLLITPLVPRFLERFEAVELSVTLTNTLPRQPEESWDVLICNGPLEQPGLAQTPLGSPPMLLCATPTYLERHGRPRAPADLKAAVVLQVFEPDAADRALRLSRGSELQEVRLRPVLEVSDPALIHASTAAGLGIGVLPEFMCRQGLATAKLERVLPEWSLRSPLQLLAVYPQTQSGAALVRQFIEFLLANMVPILSTAAFK